MKTFCSLIFITVILSTTILYAQQAPPPAPKPKRWGLMLSLDARTGFFRDPSSGKGQMLANMRFSGVHLARVNQRGNAHLFSLSGGLGGNLGIPRANGTQDRLTNFGIGARYEYRQYLFKHWKSRFHPYVAGAVTFAYNGNFERVNGDRNALHSLTISPELVPGFSFDLTEKIFLDFGLPVSPAFLQAKYSRAGTQILQSPAGFGANYGVRLGSAFGARLGIGIRF